jgi:hypothetical protein
MRQACFTWQSALIRAAIGALGGFAFALAFMAGTAALFIALNLMDRSGAVVTTGMLAFLAWALAVLVAFGAATVVRAAMWVGGGSAVFLLLARLCTHLAGAS